MDSTGGFRKDRRAFLKAAAAAAIVTPTLFAQTGGTPPRSTGAQTPGSATPRAAKITSSVMIWTLKGSVDQRFATAAKAGLQSVELVSEHMNWTDADCTRYKNLAQSYGLTIDTILSQYDWTKRPVSMVNPAHRDAFLKDVNNAIVWAKKIGVPQIIVLSGNEQPGMTHEAQYVSMVEGAKRATELAERAEVKLILENLNSKVNHKGYYLTSAQEALKCVKEVDSPHFRLLFDIYHEYVQHGDPIPTIKEAEPYVAVFHVADAPGRNDPGTGQMKWDDIYKAIARTGYSGYITFEYSPKSDEVESLIAAVTQMRNDINAVAHPSATARAAS